MDTLADIRRCGDSPAISPGPLIMCMGSVTTQRFEGTERGIKMGLDILVFKEVWEMKSSSKSLQVQGISILTDSERLNQVHTMFLNQNI